MRKALLYNKYSYDRNSQLIGIFFSVKVLSVIIALIILSSNLSAQEYPVKIYNIKNGLPFQEIFQIDQDQDGLMWFSGRSSLINYNGSEWSTIQYPEGNASFHYNKLYFDDNGDIWLYTWGKEVFRWDGNQWHPVYQKQTYYNENHITYYDMVVWNDRHVIGLTTNGHSEFFDGMKWQKLSVGNDLRVKSSFAINDTLVFYSQNRLNAYFNNEWVDFSLSDLRIEEQNISAFYYEKDSESGKPRLWFGGTKSLGYIEDLKFYTLHELDEDFIERFTFKCREILPDGAGGAITTSSNHIFRIDSNGFISSFDVLSGIKTYGATSLFLDRENNVWIGCTRGINKIRNFDFHNYRKIHGMMHDEVASIEKIGNKVYLGHYSGISIIENNKITQYPIHKFIQGSKRTNARIMDILPDKEQRNAVWLSADIKGLYHFSEKNKYVEYGLAGDAQNSSTLIQLDNGNLLNGTNDGLYEFDVNSKTFSKVYPEIKDYIRNILIVDSGDIIVSTRNEGIFQIHGDKITQYQSETERRANSTFNIVDFMGEILVGTDSGLFYLTEDGKLSRYAINNRFLNEPIYLFVKKGAELWIGGNMGVYKWANESLTFISVNDGLAGSECNRTAGITDDEGNVWIGTSEGLSKISGKFKNKKSYGILPEIISVSVDGDQFKTSEFTSTSYDKNNISFKIRYLTYRNEETAQFEYSLVNTSSKEKSTFISQAREAHFLSISPGHYRFEVKAKYGNLNWSDSVFSNEFVVSKPFVETVWFNIISIILIVAIAVLIARLLLQKRIVKGLANQVEDAREKTETIVSTTKSLMMQVDNRGKIKYLSPGIRKALGYEGIRIKNRKYIDFIHPEDRIKVYRRGALALRGSNQEQQDLQVRICNSIGKYIWYHVTISPTVVGKSVFANIIGQNIEKQKHLEEQLRHAQKLEAVGRLAGGVAHDFNNLLTAIRGYTELAMMENDEENTIDSYLQEVENTVDRASNLTGQLLAFSRKQNMKPEYINLNVVLNSMMGMLKSLLGEDIHLSVKTNDDLWIVRADIGQIEQVIINLSVNARDAMQKNGKLEILTENVEGKDEDGHPRQYVKLSVRDNGNGIPPEIQERIFEPFFTTKPKGKGTGLGLSTVYGIIRQSEGKLEYESSEGIGTTFTILLPKQDHTAENQFIVSEARVESGNDSSETILVVEDEEAVRKFTTKVLEKSGFNVISAKSGKDALELIKDFDNLDLVLSDVIMPGMSGPELINILHMKWPETKVVFMSGYAAQHFEENNINLEKMPLIQKPFKSKDLTGTLREVLDRQ